MSNEHKIFQNFSLFLLLFIHIFFLSISFLYSISSIFQTNKQLHSLFQHGRNIKHSNQHKKHKSDQNNYISIITAVYTLNYHVTSRTPFLFNDLFLRCSFGCFSCFGCLCIFHHFAKPFHYIFRHGFNNYDYHTQYLKKITYTTAHDLCP